MRSLLKESDLFESTKPNKIHKERVVFRVQRFLWLCLCVLISSTLAHELY